MEPETTATETTATEAAAPTVDDVDVEAYARTVGETSDADLTASLRENRDAVIDLIFAGMERHYRGGDKVAMVVHWEILDRADGGADLIEMAIAGGTAKSTRSPQRSPDVTLKIAAIDFVKLVTGHASGAKLFARRRVRVAGNLKLAARIPTLFAIPGKGR
jgi:hypothetical protein